VKRIAIVAEQNGHSTRVTGRFFFPFSFFFLSLRRLHAAVERDRFNSSNI
jgi:hypothetical protein